jgi:hypothetical protein
MKLNDVMGQLVSVYQDWQHMLVNPRYNKNGKVISWHNRQSLFFNEPVQVYEIIQAIELGQYSFQIPEDGAIIQIYYTFEDNNKLQGAKLAYYKIIDPLQEDENIIVDENTFSDSATVSWVRIDYQPSIQLANNKSIDAYGVIHSKCHLQISGFPNSRLPVFGIPTPKQFIEFIFAFCYPNRYKEHRLDEKDYFKNIDKMKTINEVTINFEDDAIFKLITHIKIPF